MPNASAPNAPCVDVWLSPHTIVMPGWREALLRPDDVHDALAGVAHRVAGGCRTRRSSRRAPRSAWREIGSAMPSSSPVVGHVVVHRRHGEVGPAHGAPVQAQPVERLRRRDLVHEVQVDVEQVGLARRPGGRRGAPTPSRSASAPCDPSCDSRHVGPCVSEYEIRVSWYMDSLSGVGVIDKSAAILEALAGAGPADAWRDLVEATGLSRARPRTASRSRSKRTGWSAATTGGRFRARGAARRVGAGGPTRLPPSLLDGGGPTSSPGCATRPGRARSCTCATATAGCASPPPSDRRACATPCRSGRGCRSTAGSGAKVLLAWADPADVAGRGSTPRAAGGAPDGAGRRRWRSARPGVAQRERAGPGPATARSSPR